VGSHSDFSQPLRPGPALRSHSVAHRCVVTGIPLGGTLIFSPSLPAEDKTVWSQQEKRIVDQLHGLRKLDETIPSRTTKDLALEIQQLPAVPNKLKLAGYKESVSGTARPSWVAIGVDAISGSSTRPAWTRLPAGWRSATTAYKAGAATPWATVLPGRRRQGSRRR
jgi:hypothetical protein